MKVEPMIETVQPFADYLAIKAMNASTLIHGLQSMRRLKWALDGGVIESPALAFGTDAHAAILTPDEFAVSYIVMPEFEKDVANVTDKGKPSTSKATKYYKEKVALFEQVHAGKRIITAADMARIDKMREAFRQHPDAQQWADAEAELTVTAELCGVPCKGRLDLYAAEESIADIKTTTNVGAVAFGRSFCNLGYGFKFAFYRALMRSLTGTTFDCFVIALQSQDEFDCAVYHVPNSLLDQEEQKVVRLLNRYRECEELGEWPGVPGGELWVPNWAMDDDDLEWSDVA